MWMLQGWRAPAPVAGPAEARARLLLRRRPLRRCNPRADYD